MRGFRGSRRTEGSQFGKGFVSALLMLAILAAGYNAIQWLLTVDIVDGFVDWWTSPIMMTPMELASSVMPLVLMGLIVLAVSTMMALTEV